ncbi:organic cation transporter protein-like [Aricia agestis]|uniref:organic cation transporter protein-like n=1 Tax=Aricia agestis TaxID=91739 RepID=UPI001C203D3F|nr:organic cation transporter protein-like [Aricia agestis]
MNSANKMEFETVLNEELGEIGKYQIINILLLMIPTTVSGFLASDYIFTAGRLPHRCAVPLCDGLSPEYAPEWILNAIPETSSGFADCSRYANISSDMTQNNTCPIELFDINDVVSCESFVYERTNTVVYDFGLECNEWLRALAGTLNSVGGMFALPLAGLVSDQLGRRVSIVFFAFNVALVGVVRAFSVNYYMYIALQFLQTAIGGGMFSAAYILATELVGAKYRVATSATMSSCFALGQALFGAIAAGVQPWRHLTLTAFAPAFLLLSYYWLVTESHRWLLSKGRSARAKATLERGARLNGRIISPEKMSYLLTAISDQEKLKSNSTEIPSSRLLFSRVIQSPIMLRRCCTTPVYWIATTFIYYGLSINSVSLSGNIYLNYVLIALIEIPGYWTAVLLLDRIGRKPTLFFGYMICALCCIAFSFTPNDFYGLSLILYLTGKFCIGTVFTSLYLYTLELYPTRYRHSFIAFSSMLGRIGSIVAPLTPPLMDYWSGLPSMLFGVVATTAGLLVLTQPETRGRRVPDTFEDAEDIK